MRVNRKRRLTEKDAALKLRYGEWDLKPAVRVSKEN